MSLYDTEEKSANYSPWAKFGQQPFLYSQNATNGFTFVKTCKKKEKKKAKRERKKKRNKEDYEHSLHKAHKT